MPELIFAVPGDPNQRTGGYLYDRRLAVELAKLGWQVTPLRLPDDFPTPSRQSVAAVDELLAGLADGELVMIDGLAFGAMPDLAERHGSRVRLAALVHHPLGYEAGLSPELAAALIASERAALAHACRVLVTSTSTKATLVEDFAVPAERIAAALPGTDPAPRAAGSGSPGPAMLAVGQALPRKDFPALIDALAPWCDYPWTLTIAGSIDRDPTEAARLQDAIGRHGLVDRVTLVGEIDADALAELLHRTDLFVSSSRYEGFGMAIAEAVARGLPVVAVAGGAVAEWLDQRGAILVPADRPQALSAALGKVIGDPDELERLRGGAAVARQDLPTWQQCAQVASSLLHEALLR